MNAIRLTQTISQGRVHHLIDLKAFDPPLPKFFEDRRHICLARRRRRIQTRIVCPELQDDDFCPVRNGAGKASQHVTRSVSGHTFIRHTKAGALGLANSEPTRRTSVKDTSSLCKGSE